MLFHSPPWFTCILNLFALVEDAVKYGERLTVRVRMHPFESAVCVGVAVLALIVTVAFRGGGGGGGTGVVVVTHHSTTIPLLAHEYPREPCIAFATHHVGDGSYSLEESIGAQLYYMRTQNMDGITAAHVNDAHCVACVRDSENDREPVLVMVNPVMVGESQEMRTSAERDPLCKIDRVTRFRRAHDVVVRYDDALDRRTHVRRFTGRQASTVQHVLDVLAARQVCG